VKGSTTGCAYILDFQWGRGVRKPDAVLVDDMRWGHGLGFS